MNPDHAPRDVQDVEAETTPPVPVATTILHTADIAVAVSFSDGSSSAGGRMTPELAADVTAAIMGHLAPVPEDQDTNQDADAPTVPSVATVEVPVAIDLGDFARWYEDRSGPFETAAPHPAEHPQLAAEYLQHLLTR